MPSTSWPSLPGVTPATTCAPLAIMRRVCLVPSDPVMPWTWILLLESSQMAICCSLLSCRASGCEFGDPAGGVVHGFHEFDEVVLGLFQDATSFFGVIAVDAAHDRLGDGFAALGEHRHRLHDAIGDRVAGGDAAEDIDEHRFHPGITEDDVQAVGHHLGRRPATDIQEVRRLDST